MVAIAIMTFSALCHDVRASESALSRGQEENAGVVALFSGLSPADGDLLGTWTIDRVKVKKTVGGVSSENIYSSGQRFETFIPCPKKVTFSADGNSVFEYDNGKTDGPFEYTVEGDQIKRMIQVAVYTYKYTGTNNGELQLVVSVRHAGDSGLVEEEYTYYATKK